MEELGINYVSKCKVLCFVSTFWFLLVVGFFLGLHGAHHKAGIYPPKNKCSKILMCYHLFFLLAECVLHIYIYICTL